MANLTISGLDGLQLSLEQIATIPDDVVKDMLNAEAEAVIQYQRRSIQDLGLSPNGRLLKSIGAKTYTDQKGRPYVDVFPQGVHHVNPGGTKVRNAELGFIYEYGAKKKKHITPRQWMRTANEKAAKDVDAAALNVYNDYLQKNDL